MVSWPHAHSLRWRGRVRSKNGVGGFFEAALAMMVITVGVAVIVSALGAAAIGLNEKTGHGELEEGAQRLLADAMRAILCDSRADVVSFDLAASGLDDLALPEHAEGFRIVLKEAVEDAADVLIAENGVPGQSIGDRVCLGRPVLVAHSTTDRRAALLTVVVW
jgi:hypothetical protein